ncbi:hypothetical protein Pd630_LPD16117 (plasmid) [Rhodococcus opacus PD630]|nr:hypothetical protein Pd630_LPD16117 [Rhodococcus opacus PD630]
MRRSNALRDWAYGRTFKYREVMGVGDSPLSTLYAGGGPQGPHAQSEFSA